MLKVQLNLTLLQLFQPSLFSDWMPRVRKNVAKADTGPRGKGKLTGPYRPVYTGQNWSWGSLVEMQLFSVFRGIITSSRLEMQSGFLSGIFEGFQLEE